MDIKKSLGIMESLGDRKMKFSYEEYISQTEKKKNFWDNPDEKYKEQFIPNLLYKYWSFLSGHIEENLEKICNNEIWMPKAKILNDPYEFQMITDNLYENERLAYREDILARNSVLSLCDSYNNNLLWSHYGYGHSGLCIEFDVRNKYFILPITYIDKQIDATEDIRKWLQIKRGLSEKRCEEWSTDDWVAMRKFERVMYYKYIDWMYENEYRITARNMMLSKSNIEWDIEDGFWLDLGKYCHIYVKEIILGFNCSLQNKAKVIEVVNKHNYDMFMKKMIERDFKDTMENCIDDISNNGDLITISKMNRVGNTLELQKKELEKDERHLLYI